MINNYVNESLFRTDSVHKDWHITGSGVDISNSDLYGESIDLFESIVKDRNIIFGSCIADTLKFNTFDTATSFKDKVLTVSVVLDHDTQNPFPVGQFVVDEETLSTDRTQKVVTAYHPIYYLINRNVAAWYNSLNFPLTKKQFRDSFFAYCGIIQETAVLANDDMIVEKTIDANEISGLKILNAICEASGVLGHMSRTGTFKYIQLGTTPVYNVTVSMYEICDYGDYVVEPISKLQIRQENGDIGVIIGSGDNNYVIEDNFLFYGKGTEELEEIAENIFNVVSVVTYTPCRIDCLYGNLCLEVGDLIQVTKKDGSTFLTYVLSRTIKGLQYLTDTLESEGDAIYPDEVNGINYDIRQLKGKSNSMERTIERTQSTIVNLERGLSSVTQTAEDLTVRVESIQQEIDGEITYYETTADPTLTNYPAWDFTSAFKCDGTKKCAPLYKNDMTLAGEGETGQYPHFYYSDQDYQDHLRDLAFNRNTAVSYRFNKRQVGDTTEWYWQEIAEGETGYILQQLSELKVTSQGLESTVSELDVEVTSQGGKIAEHTSQISQNARDITAEVTRSSEVEGDLDSRLTVAERDISAKVSKNSPEGQTSFSWKMTDTYMQWKKNGSEIMYLGGSGLKVTGEVNALTGTIAGWGISAAAISKTNGSNTIRIQSDGTIVNMRDGQIKYALQYDGHAVFNDVTINGYVTTGQLSAVDAKFTNLNADYITSGTINAARIAAGSITGSKLAAGTITGDKISANAFSGSTFTGSDFNVGTLHSTNGFVWLSGFKFTPVQSSGDLYVLRRTAT